MSPQLDDEVGVPRRRRTRGAEAGVTDPHCEHCGAAAHFVVTAQHWIHRYGSEACGYAIKSPTEGRAVFEAPPTRVRTASIYLLPGQEPSPREDRPRAAKRRLNTPSKPKSKSRWA